MGKKRGSLEAQYEGNVTLLYNNDSVVNQNEWNELLSQIFDVNECKFKHKDLNMIQAYIDPLYFFQKQDYKVLRALLEPLVGDVTMEDIIAKEPACAIAKEEIIKYSGDASKARTGVNKVISDKTTGLDAKIMQIEVQLDVLPQIPYDAERHQKLMDESFNLQMKIKNLKENPSSKLTQLRVQKEVISKKYNEEIDVKIKNISSKKSEIQSHYVEEFTMLSTKLRESQKNDLTMRKNTNLIEAQSRLQVAMQERYEVEAQSLNAKSKYNTLKDDYTRLLNEIAYAKSKIDTLNNRLASVVASHAEVKVCPHCGGVLNDDAVADFENKRSKDILDIKTSISSYESQNAENQAKIEVIKANASNSASEYKALTLKCESIDKGIELIKAQVEAAKNTPFEQYSEETKKIEAELNELEKAKNKAINDLAAERERELNELTEKADAELRKVDAEIQLAEVDNATYIEAQVRTEQEALDGVLNETQELIRAKGQNEAREAKIKELERVQYERNEKQALYDAINLFIQTEIKLVNEKCYDATGIKFIMLEDQFNGGLKEVCYPVYSDGGVDIPFANCSTSRKLILGCQMIESLKKLIGSNDLPIMADRCEALDDEHLKMLGDEQMFITQVSNDEQIITIQED